MKKLSVKDLIDFRKRTPRGKKSLVEAIKLNKPEPPKEGGGDYWVTSLSAVCNSYKEDDLTLIDEKIIELQEKHGATKDGRTKNMYQRNIEVLQEYKKMDLQKLRPKGAISPLKRSTGNPLLTIKGLQVQARPSHIYTFGRKGEEKVGAIWFTAKVDGYRIEEVGMFCDMLYRFLKHNYSKKYQVIPRYCIAIDVLSGRITDYSQIESGILAPVLATTLDEIIRLM